jgi:hypothetical protein
MRRWRLCRLRHRQVSSTIDPTACGCRIGERRAQPSLIQAWPPIGSGLGVAMAAPESENVRARIDVHPAEARGNGGLEVDDQEVPDAQIGPDDERIRYIPMAIQVPTGIPPYGR